eukprot:scaffold103179_cov24-Attheya_sp.AAC.1
MMQVLIGLFFEYVMYIRISEIVRVVKPVEICRRNGVEERRKRKKVTKWCKIAKTYDSDRGGSCPESLWMRILNAVPRGEGCACIGGLVVRMILFIFVVLVDRGLVDLCVPFAQQQKDDGRTDNTINCPILSYSQYFLVPVQSVLFFFLVLYSRLRSLDSRFLGCSFFLRGDAPDGQYK